MSYQDDIRDKGGDYKGKNIALTKLEKEDEDSEKTILDDKVMMYIHDNYEEIGVPRPVLYRKEQSQHRHHLFDDDVDDSIPVEWNFIQYYAPNKGSDNHMWLRIILRYFDQNEIPDEVSKYLQQLLSEKDNYYFLMDKITDFYIDEWHSFFPEIIKLLKKLGLKIPKDDVFFKTIKEIIE